MGSEWPGLNPGIFFTAVGKSLNLSINEDNNTCLRGITKSTSTPLVAQTVKGSTYNAGDLGSIPGVGKIPWRRKWQPTAVLLPGESHGWRSLVGYSPWGHKELDMTFFLQMLLSSILFQKGFKTPVSICLFITSGQGVNSSSQQTFIESSLCLLC